MNFKELVLQAKFGDRTATTELLMLYQPLLLKESIIFLRHSHHPIQAALNNSS